MKKFAFSLLFITSLFIASLALPQARPFRVDLKGVTIESPTDTEDITLFFTDDAITITQLNAVSVGTTPSVTYTIRHDPDRSATGYRSWRSPRPPSEAAGPAPGSRPASPAASVVRIRSLPWSDRL